MTVSNHLCKWLNKLSVKQKPRRLWNSKLNEADISYWVHSSPESPRQQVLLLNPMPLYIFSNLSLWSWLHTVRISVSWAPSVHCCRWSSVFPLCYLLGLQFAHLNCFHIPAPELGVNPGSPQKELSLLVLVLNWKLRGKVIMPHTWSPRGLHWTLQNGVLFWILHVYIKLWA